jgi:hypothetical protein
MIALTNNLTPSSATSGNNRAKRTMFALGQKQTFRSAIVMSALPPKATLIACFGMSALGQKRTLPPDEHCHLSRVVPNVVTQVGWTM